MSTGKAHIYGNNIDTDVIIPARYLNRSDEAHLAAYCMADIDASFADRVQPGDVIFAGSNFGCGSSREHAPMAIKASGVSCVVAKSFARIFLRNAVNIGLTVIEADHTPLGLQSGDAVALDMANGQLTNLSSGQTIDFPAPPPFMQAIIEAGGLIPYVLAQKGATHEKP